MNEHYSDDEISASRSKATLIVLLLLAAVSAGAYWWFKLRAPVVAVAAGATAPLTAPPASPSAVASAAARAVVLHPLNTGPASTDTTGSAQPVDDDATVAAGFAALFGATSVADILMPDGIARRLVATTDGLTQGKFAERLRPIKPLASVFGVLRTPAADTVEEDQMVIAAENSARYTAAVQALHDVPASALASAYRSIYPVLQRNYETLGYPDGYFNDRVVEVIDHLLATPEIVGPIALIQPKAMYEYADVKLEALSSGQKLMIRLGADNARVVKQKLMEFRAQIARSN